MNLSKPLSLGLGLAMAALCCTVSAQDSGTLQKIKDNGFIQIGARDSQIPFSYKIDASGDPIGFTNDICLQIVEAVKTKLGLPKLEVRYTMLNSTNRIPLLQNGTVDLDCATTTNSTQRQQQVDFAPSHFATSITAAVKKSSGITSLADLNGKTVATVSGSTSIQLLRAARKNSDFDVKELAVKDTSDGFILLSTGRADAYVLDDVQLAGMIATAPNPAEYTILTHESLRQEPYGIMLRKNDPEFKALVDETVSGLMKSGAIEQIYSKWFESPIPPRNANLHFPMTDAVRALYNNPNNKGI
ncbi:transporter substrate-binding domain-containing protein [Lampropedia puyangensis]|uniref:Transporter substrate-binding domain-containing protein n=1 Tax=Lampropedia puyangensis TaxID=1330072 RepID=A0A4S8EUP7_9BURK|nr:transporter substrate-binding domain-containing protein [Lampropedia puyangensis]THT98462.1 transporter substrate-binding domain-containing protein [Lampropedia puyangensis]